MSSVLCRSFKSTTSASKKAFSALAPKGSPSKSFVRSLKYSVKDYDNEYIRITDNAENVVEFSTVFLRDACNAPDSVDTHSRQKLFTTGEVAKNLKVSGQPKFVEDPRTGEDALQVFWNQEGKIHESRFPVSFLIKNSSYLTRREGKFLSDKNVTWDQTLLLENLDSLSVDYQDYFNNDSDFFKALVALNRYGLAFIENIPDPVSELGETMTEENSSKWPVAKLAQRFGYIKKTFYGTLFDVKNVSKAKNIAYTNSFLPLHMDLCYYESPPGLQLLHTINNSTLGGDNIFCDSFAAVEAIREKDPEAYLALTKIPITFQYDNNNEFYYYQRPLVVEDEYNLNITTGLKYVKEVNYSPPFQGPYEVGIIKTNLSVHGSATDPTSEEYSHYLFLNFLRGIQMFEDFINDPVNHYQIKMKEGSAAIFDNRRTLHSRLEFSDENGGKRWLMGCYVDGDSFRSKMRVGYRKFT